MPRPRKPIPTDSSLDAEGMRHGARAIVLKPLLKNAEENRAVEAILAEAVGLAKAIALEVVAVEALPLPHPTPATLLGSGQVANWEDVIRNEKVALAIIDHTLTPVQQRNLERAWSCKVIDRTGLILEIFGERARTREGQLQVELAALSYQKSRLVRSWTHLERQRGGYGFLGGPGESQLEIDRRLIAQRIAKLKEDLAQVRRTRGLSREARQRAERPTIALVGYTNAGKSTLFNRLTGADAVAKNMLFATLDPSLCGLTLPSGQKVVLSDTVGFISDLPTSLVEAFRATLEEVQEAAVILHVRDASHPETRVQKEAVESILADLGIANDDPRLIEVLNKIDLLPKTERKHLKDCASRTSWDSRHAPSLEGLRQEARGGTVGVSALTGEGIDDLLRLLDHRLTAQRSVVEVTLPPDNGAALAWLYRHGHVLNRKNGKTKVALKVALDKADLGRLKNKFGGQIGIKG